MQSNRIDNYYPNAMLVFVSGFQGSVKGSDAYIVSNLSKKGDDKGKLIQSLSVELTVRNNPGTFNATIFHPYEQLMESDNPVTEIPTLYKYSHNKQIREASTNSPKGASSKTVTVTNSKEPGNYYEYPDYNTWLSEDNMILEETSTGNRFPLMKYTLNSVITYWTFDFDGNVFKIPSSVNLSTTDDKTILSLSYTGIKGAGTKNFVLHKQLTNSLFVTNYKDTTNQGSDNNIFLHGRCRIKPMDRVMVFMTERFTSDNRPGMIRCFTGLINNVEEGYTEGRASVTISGEDVTKFMKISLVNANPAILLSQDTDVLQTKDQGITVWGDMFKGMRTPDIIRLCTVGAKPDANRFPHLTYSIDGIGTYTLDSTFPAGLAVKFSQDDNSWIKTYKEGKETKASLQEILGVLFTQNTVHICDPYTYNKDLVGFRPYALSLGGSWSFYQGDWKTKRDIAYRAAEDSHFVFYADRNGEIWFHPPRFSNSWILGAENPLIYIIDTSSIISYGFVESDENIYTVAFVSTEPPLEMEATKEIGFFDKSFRDDGAVLKYGYRIFTGSNPVINVGNSKVQSDIKTVEDYTADSKHQSSIIMYCKSLLQRLLAQKYQGQITILGRPELDPGRPVYIPYRNMIYYVETVQHQLDAGGNFTTTLHLSYGRKPWEILPELLTMAEHDEIYMTDAALFTEAQTQSLTKEQQQQLKNPFGDKPKTTTKGNNLSRAKNFEILMSTIINPLQQSLHTVFTISRGVFDERPNNTGSDHPLGKAVDITDSQSFNTVLDLYNAVKGVLRSQLIPFDQCIYEVDHVHIGNGFRGRRQFLIPDPNWNGHFIEDNS